MQLYATRLESGGAKHQRWTHLRCNNCQTSDLQHTDTLIQPHVGIRRGEKAVICAANVADLESGNQRSGTAFMSDLS